MKKIEIWKVGIASTQLSEAETIYVQASNPGTASKRALKIAKTNEHFEGYTARERQTLYALSASFENYIYLF